MNILRTVFCILGLATLAACSSDNDNSGPKNCFTCEAYTIGDVVTPRRTICRNANGNAFIDGDDTGQVFETFISLQEVTTTCE